MTATYARTIEPNTDTFSAISTGIREKGYAVIRNGLPLDLANALYQQVNSSKVCFKRAAVGRMQSHTFNQSVRGDETCWIDGNSPAEIAWIKWAESLQSYLNQQLFLGLQSFDSQFSHFSPGSFYKMHLDAFADTQYRFVTLITYLNPMWNERFGGQLVIKDPSQRDMSKCVLPEFGTVVAFLSREFPHTVLPTWRDRYSIAGWYSTEDVFQVKNSMIRR